MPLLDWAAVTPLHRTLALPLLAMCLLAAPGCHHYARPARPLAHRWVYLTLDLARDTKAVEAERILQRAAAAGYNGAVLTGLRLFHPERLRGSYLQNVRRLRKVAASLHIELIPAVCPFGYSGAYLAQDPNLIEALPARDVRFVVRGGRAELAEPQPALVNPGFEMANGDAPAGWEPASGADIAVDRDSPHSGAACLRIAHGQVGQHIALTPYHFYRLSVWIRSSGLEDPDDVALTIRPDDGTLPSLSRLDLNVRASQPWTRHVVVFDSLGNTGAALLVGPVSGGTLWMDDVQLDQSGLVNLVRREGCPLTVRRAGGATYQEGRDFAPVRDPLLGRDRRTGGYDIEHTPPVLSLVPGSRIRDGETLLVSYYAPVFVHDMQVGCCLTDSKVFDLVREQAATAEKLLHPAAYLMNHDEVRVADWCGLCQAQHKTPGELLAANVQRCRAILHNVSPQARLYDWSDMFDPYHNAHDRYFLANGTWEGSWKGLTPDIGIVDWYPKIAARDLPFFAARGNHQLLAGYYDGDVDETRRWLEGSTGVPGVDGVMYTTWRGDYSKLEAFAQAVWGARSPGG